MIQTIHIIGIAQASVVGLVLLLSSKKSRQEFHYLSAFLLCNALAIGNELFGDVYEVGYHALYPFKFFFLLPNLVYLHVNSKIIGANAKKTVLRHLIPGALELLLLIVIMTLVHSNIINRDGDFLFYFEELYNYSTIVYIIVIQIAILRKVNLYNKHIFAFLSTVQYKYLNWLRWACWIMIANELCYILIYSFVEDLEASDYPYMIYALIELFLIFYIGIGALLQVNLRIEIPIIGATKDQAPEDVAQGQKRPIAESSDCFQEVELFMQQHKPYLSADLNLTTLSKLTHLSERQLSQAINSHSKQNFYSYINEYRVKEVQRLLKADESERFSMAGIGEAAGFKSKSSFYMNFKKVTGMSPAQYLKNKS